MWIENKFDELVFVIRQLCPMQTNFGSHHIASYPVLSQYYTNVFIIHQNLLSYQKILQHIWKCLRVLFRHRISEDFPTPFPWINQIRF